MLLEGLEGVWVCLGLGRGGGGRGSVGHDVYCLYEWSSIEVSADNVDAIQLEIVRKDNLSDRVAIETGLWGWTCWNLVLVAFLLVKHTLDTHSYRQVRR
jgi:hypothetical protein